MASLVNRVYKKGLIYILKPKFRETVDFFKNIE